MNKTSTDKSKVETLFVKEEKALFNIAYRWVWNRQEAADLMQEAFLKLWEIRNKIDSQNWKPYLYRTLINLCSKKYRSKKIWKWVSTNEEELVNQVDMEDSFIELENSSKLKKAVIELPEKLKKVILITEFSEMSYQDAAKVLKIPEGTIASRKNKAIKLLKEKLKENT